MRDAAIINFKEQRRTMALRKEEINRKALHALSGTIIPALVLYLPLFGPRFSWLPAWLTPRLYPAVLTGLTAALLTAIEIVRVRSAFMQRVFYSVSGGAMRPEEAKKMTGATYIFYAALACSIVFVDNPSISFMALSAFIWGDAAAALVGQSIGKTRIGSKTLEGSLGCFFLCLALFFLVFPALPHVLSPWRGAMPPFMGLLASMCITVLELFPITIGKNFIINDNLTVPLITGIMMLLLFPPVH
jgi:dolichol kinase